MDNLTGPHYLKQVLRSWQIFFLSITTVIGTGVFTDYGSVIATAGRGNLIIAVGIVGLTAIALMECLSEMSQLFPCVNPLVEYVHEFVDPELAICAGVAYWFAFSSFLALQLATAASYLGAYTDNLLAKIFIFYVFAPILIVFVNLKNVKVRWLRYAAEFYARVDERKWYANLETAGGFLKICSMIATIMILCFLAGKLGDLDNFGQLALTHYAASLAVNYVSFSFIGVESVAVTTFEAYRTADLRLASQSIAYVTVLIYLLSAVASSMCKDTSYLVGLLRSTTEDGRKMTSFFAVEAARSVKEYTVGNALNGIMIYCALSAANTTVYIASRAMYGFAHHLRRGTARLYGLSNLWVVEKMEYVTDKGVPKWSVWISLCAFGTWLPFSQISSSETAHELLEFFVVNGNVCVIFVWGCQCLAYLRYWIWQVEFRALHVCLAAHEFSRLKQFQNSEYLAKNPWLNRWSRDLDTRGFATLLNLSPIPLQPGLSIFGLTMSFSIFFALSTSPWWGRGASTSEWFRYYLVPVLVPVLWMVLKASRGRSALKERRFGLFVHLSRDPHDFALAITNLRQHLKIDQGTDLSKPATVHEQSSQEMCPLAGGDQEERNSNGNRRIG
ncbi:uncharacterized protein Z518_08456 [Rhinocladiella mackenziei CBS 650.93]|uniref:Amino acid permease/ SLC12A domain-containing protein n=1 Tax=Rhinocladiella mackenziei CBS 650.93 TaxID=1442369 RepID=A0A0D2J0Y9_9EURO|nr:uncharacterized protein Z518_08456 [Rhinocladiella mackenziei CBS 650.93]KIX02515.1 hypothetical protein Z518_08456 [Rhinocladiella mackenziei CBS 650.93]